jgi:hypothetical protein
MWDARPTLGGVSVMDEIDKLLNALCAAAIDGDREAALFLQMFAPWALENAKVSAGL